MGSTGKITQQSPTQAISAAVDDKVMPAQEPLKQDSYKEGLQGLAIQRKLSIGAVDDPLEDEADAMADKVMRMPEQPFVQRKWAECEEEEKVQRKPLASSITPFIQTKGADGGTASDAVTQQIHATRGSGSNLDRPTQSFMESRFGTDFSNVKIHTGDDAVQMSRELNAQAFTVGSDIYFNSGKYNPSSHSGKHLLAHELTHTIQQNSGIHNKKIQRLQYLRQLSETESQPYLGRFDASLATLQTNIRSPHIPIPQDVTDAVALLARFRAENRITCWETSGGLVYASYDNASQTIRLHIYFGQSTNPSTILHEAIHALHAARFPEIARVYSVILAAGGTTDSSLALLMLRWKTWTEYWAYRGVIEYNNSRQTDPAHRQDAHREALAVPDVSSHIRQIRTETGEDFDPSAWEPPERWRPPAAYRRRRSH
jgi:Domain of unknown function (DUF4157)